MKDFEKTIEAAKLSHELAKLHEWDKWQKEIPFINWPSEWEVKAVPPSICAIVRYRIRLIGTGGDENDTKEVSVYLDCYDELGVMGQPYWEVYPGNEYGDTSRSYMNATEDLIHDIWRGLIWINDMKPQNVLPEGHALLTSGIYE